MSDPDLVAVERTDLETEIRRNRHQASTAVLAHAALVFVVGAIVGVVVGIAASSVVGWIVVGLALVVAVGFAWFARNRADAVALSIVGAVPADGSEHRRYHNLVEGLCVGAGLPKPRLFVVDDPAPNAFVVGRDPEHAALVVTSGLLATTSRLELEGVLALELAHVKNFDVAVQTVAVVAVGSRRSLSRRDESAADAAAVAVTRYPPGLAAALRTLDAAGPVGGGHRATAHLWIVPPVDPRPSLLERIALLEAM